MTAPVAGQPVGTMVGSARSAGLARRTVLALGLLAVLVGTAFTVVLLAIAELRQSAALASHSDQVLAAANRATFAAAAGVAGSILLVLLFTGYLARTILRPVRRAAAMAGLLAAGDLTVRLPETGAEEFGALERAFNTMGGSLEASHNELRLLVEEQAGLRRVATLVARAVPPAEVFDAVCGEVSRLLDAPVTRLLRYGPDGTATILAGRGELGGPIPVGAPWPLADEGVAAAVLRTGSAARLEHVERALGAAALARQPGLRSAVAGPIVVEGRLWGVMAAGWMESGRLASGIEGRLAQFTELVATAIANADSRVELAASRARVVAAADETRRRIERDLHDGAQQRLVSLALDLRAAEASAPSELVELKAQLSRTADGLAGAVDNLREVSRGIHPAILSQGGLGPALKTLARRSSVPVQLDVSVDRRLPENVEVAVYYFVSEALTNVVKHAHASVVHIDLEADEGMVRLSVRDDGVGGATCGQGSGLIGLRDRIEALGGTIDIASSEGKGTILLVKIPLPPLTPKFGQAEESVLRAPEVVRRSVSYGLRLDRGRPVAPPEGVP